MDVLRRATKECTYQTLMEAIRRTNPATLREAVEQQLRRITPLDYSLLAAGSVAGRTFSAAAVTAALNQATGGQGGMDLYVSTRRRLKGHEVSDTLP